MNERADIPDTFPSITKRFALYYPDGKPYEFYVHIGPPDKPMHIRLDTQKQGEDAHGHMAVLGHTLSDLLRHGASVEQVASEYLVGTRFQPQGLTGDPEFPSVTSPLDYLGKWMIKRWPEKANASG